MGDALASQAVAQALTTPPSVSDNVVIVGLLFLLGAVILILAIARPIMAMAKGYKDIKADNAKSNAEISLYEQLQEQITNNTKTIERLLTERADWAEKAINLEYAVKQLKDMEALTKELRAALAKKESIIQERDVEARLLHKTITDMKDQMHGLEMRMQEFKMKPPSCVECIYRKEILGGDAPDISP